MVQLEIKGVVFNLAFTLDAMDAMEEATGKTLGEQTFSIKSKAARADLVKTLHILAREGAKMAGEPLADAYNVRWFQTYMTPGKLLEAVNAVTDAISEGMRMETDEPDENKEVDLVLEELKKKEKPDD